MRLLPGSFFSSNLRDFESIDYVPLPASLVVRILRVTVGSMGKVGLRRLLVKKFKAWFFAHLTNIKPSIIKHVQSQMCSKSSNYLEHNIDRY